MRGASHQQNKNYLKVNGEQFNLTYYRNKQTTNKFLKESDD